MAFMRWQAPDIAQLVIAILLIGMDLGVAAWFKEQKMRQFIKMNLTTLTTLTNLFNPFQSF